MIKECTVSYPVLKSLNYDIPFLIQTNVFEVGVGAVLSQIGSRGQEHPVDYYSETVLLKEQHYATIDKRSEVAE